MPILGALSPGLLVGLVGSAAMHIFRLGWEAVINCNPRKGIFGVVTVCVYQQNLTAGQPTSGDDLRSHADARTICCMQAASFSTARMPERLPESLSLSQSVTDKTW